MYPPKLPSARIGRSRLTIDPAPKFFRLVRSSVSRESSAVKLPLSCWRTVRQTPFTEILAPADTPSRIPLARTRSVRNSLLSSTETISPTSSMIPVNISGDSDVGILLSHVPVAKLKGIGQPLKACSADGRHFAPAEDPGRDKHDYLINDSRFEGAESQIRPAFQHKTLNLPFLQLRVEFAETASKDEPAGSFFNPVAAVENNAEKLAAAWEARAIGHLRPVFK